MRGERREIRVEAGAWCSCYRERGRVNDDAAVQVGSVNQLRGLGGAALCPGRCLIHRGRVQGLALIQCVREGAESDASAQDGDGLGMALFQWKAVAASKIGATGACHTLPIHTFCLPCPSHSTHHPCIRSMRKRQAQSLPSTKSSNAAWMMGDWQLPRGKSRRGPHHTHAAPLPVWTLPAPTRGLGAMLRHSMRDGATRRDPRYQLASPQAAVACSLPRPRRYDVANQLPASPHIRSQTNQQARVRSWTCALGPSSCTP
jgi:hypothetical protein